MMPALLIKTWTVPKALTAASITFLPSATDPGAVAAFPPATSVSLHGGYIKAKFTLLDLVNNGLSCSLRDVIHNYRYTSRCEE